MTELSNLTSKELEELLEKKRNEENAEKQRRREAVHCSILLPMKQQHSTR